MNLLHLFLLLLIPSFFLAQDHISVYNKGVEAQKSQRYQEAIEHYKTCLKIQPKFSKALSNIGIAHYNMALQNYENKAYESALEQLNKAQKYRPEDPKIAYMQGNCKHEQGNYQEAVKQYDIAIKMTDKAALFYAARAWSNNAMNQQEQGLKDMQSAAKADSSKASYPYHCGRFKQEISQKLYKTAVQDFDAALAIDPNYEEAYRERGAYFMTFGQFKKALPDLLRAKELGAEDVDSFIDAAKFELQTQQND